MKKEEIKKLAEAGKKHLKSSRVPGGAKMKALSKMKK